MKPKRTPEYFAGKKLKVGIMGCGYVGLPLALRFSEYGHQVMGFDLDAEKVEKLNCGESYIKHISSEHIAEQVQAKRFSATTDFARLREMDAILICVPTPLDERQNPDTFPMSKTQREPLRRTSSASN